MNRYAPFLGLSLLMAGISAVPQVNKAQPPKPDDEVLKSKRNGKEKPVPVANKGMTWKFLFEKGRTTKFKESLTLSGNLADGSGFSIEQKSIQTEIIRDVSKTGDGTIETRNEVGEVTKDGEPAADPPAPSGKVTTAVYGKNGLLIKRTPSNTGRSAEILNKIAPIVLSMPTPSKAVQPGDEWKTEFDNPFLPDQKVVVTSQFAEQGKFGTMPIYRIQLTAIVSVRDDDEENADAIQVSGTYEFEPVKGRVVKSMLTVENVEMEIQGQKARTTVQAVLSLIGTPDQMLPKPGKVKTVSSPGKKKK